MMYTILYKAYDIISWYIVVVDMIFELYGTNLKEEGTRAFLA